MQRGPGCWEWGGKQKPKKHYDVIHQILFDAPNFCLGSCFPGDAQLEVTMGLGLESVTDQSVNCFLWLKFVVYCYVLALRPKMRKIGSAATLLPQGPRSLPAPNHILGQVRRVAIIRVTDSRPLEGPRTGTCRWKGNADAGVTLPCTLWRAQKAQ